MMSSAAGIFSALLPVFLALDLVIPFLLAPSYKGYNHLTQVMSVLGNSNAPLHSIYNLWLVVLGIAILISIPNLYPAIAKTSVTVARLLSFVVIVYAIGGCILSGIFSVGETKNLETLSAKIHGCGSATGFSLLMFAPLLTAVHFFSAHNTPQGIVSVVCFIFATTFFTLFVMADKAQFCGTPIACEGLWQRLSLLSMYIPIMLICFCRE